MSMTDMKSSMALLGHTALIPVDDVFIMNQRVGRIRVKDPNILDIHYLYYLSNTPEFINQIRTKANSGVQVNLTTNGIMESKVSLPPLPVQQKIASILGALDDKIELNRRMNRTLESIAQALFKHMFVDNPEREGWEEKKINDIAQVVDLVANGSFASLRENINLLDQPSYALFIRTTDSRSNFSNDLRYVDKSTYDFLRKPIWMEAK